METRSNPTVQFPRPIPDPRSISPPRFVSGLYVFFCLNFLALSLITSRHFRQRSFPSSRLSTNCPRFSTNDPRSRFLSAPTQILGRNAKDDRFPLHALVEYGRWRYDRFRDRTKVHRRVVSVSPIVQPKMLGEKRTLVSRRRIIAYRSRRKRGRIKLCFERRKARPSEQKISEKVGHVPVHCFDQDGDKAIPSINVTNSRVYGLLLFFPPSARTNPPFLVDKLYAAADQSARQAGFHDLSVTIVVASHTGAKEKSGSWIPRSPTRTQRESSNAKFQYQWHERVVFCFGLLTCIMLTRLIIFPMTHISLNNEARLIETFSLLYLPFPSLFPALNKQTYAFETGQRATPTVDQPILMLAHESFPAGSVQDQAKSS